MESYDVIVVGGSFAGLSASMQLARARRKILLLDTGKPRNRFSAASHGFLGQDGRSPKQIMETGREQLLAYPTVQYRQAEAMDAVKEDGGFVVALADRDSVRAKRLILATGMVDHLPDIPGMQELWGKSVLHCPYCHGYEVADRKLAIYGAGDIALHQAMLVRDWSDDVTLLTGGMEGLTPEAREQLKARGVAIDETPVERFVSSGDSLSGIEFRDGRTVPYIAVFTASRSTFASPIAERLGCEIEQGRTGPIIKASDMKETTVPGVFAAGDIARAMYNATLASADGVMAGASAHRSLIF